MSELISSPLFLLIAGLVAIFLIIGIIKHTWRFLILIVVIVVVLFWLGIVKESDVHNWIENLRKTVER